MKQVLYQSYGGNEPYIFMRYGRADRDAALGIVNTLVEMQFRICFDEHDEKSVSDFDWLADRILSCELAVFLISAGSLKSLGFRNCINFALSKNKKVFCIYLDDQKMDYGFDMQLANVPGIRASGYQNTGDLCGDMVKSGDFTQNVRGEDARVPMKNNRRKKLAVWVTVIVLAAFVAVAVPATIYRVNYDNSMAGQLEKMVSADYLDISNQDASLIDLLKGKTVGTLVARNMGLTDIEALGQLNCGELDISQNPKVNTLEPLLEIKDLKTVKVTQDMVPAITRISGRHSFKIVVTG